MKAIPLVIIILLLTSSTVFAGQADVLKVEVERTGENTFHFDVTVHHNDEGWDHYANSWDVVAPDGKVLATRVLHHPHEKRSRIASPKYPFGPTTPSMDMAGK